MMRYGLVLASLLPGLAMAAPVQTYRFADNAVAAFTATVNHAPYHGRFSGVHGEVAFAADRLEASSANARIDLASLKTDDADSEKDLQEKAWFDVATYSAATFRSQHFGKKENGHFEVTGWLDLHGVKQPVSIDFTLKQEGGVITQADGSTEIDRHAFHIGSGEWASDDPVEGKVKIALTLPVTPMR